DDVPVAIEATVGVALFPEHAENIDDLVQRADVALHIAKAEKADWQVFEPRADEQARPRLTLLPELREALACEQLVLHYQPQLDASSLTLELTESAIMSDPFRAVTVLTELRGMGVRLSIDDFGTGYSSLAYLKRLPVTEIKIDRSFVSNVAGDHDDAAIVLST